MSPKLRVSGKTCDRRAALAERGDPLLRLLNRLSGGRYWRILAIVVGIYGILIMALGTAISLYYDTKGIQFLSILDKQRLPVEVLVNVFFIPTIWLFYVWQPKGIVGAIEHLENSQVFAKPEDCSLAEFANEPIDRLSYRFGSVIPLVGTMAALVVWLTRISVPSAESANPYSYYGGLPTWQVVNPFYFWIVWIPLAFVNVYIALWILTRQVMAIVIFTRLFRRLEIRPRPFHPDQCNGFAPVGDFAMKNALIAVLLGFFASGTIMSPMVFGHPANLQVEVILILALYTITTPGVLLSPVWQAHKAMANAKQRTLDSMAWQIQDVLNAIGLEEIVSKKDTLEAFLERYYLLEQELRTWPFRPVDLRRFGLSAIAPLISSGVSIIVDKYL